jgi:Adenovirus IVa2 protein
VLCIFFKLNMETLMLNHPFTCIISGPTKSGKTFFVKKLIENCQKMIDPPPEKIWFCFAEQQKSYDELGDMGVYLIEGMPDLGIIRSNVDKPQLLIFDDLMQELENDKNLVKLFTRGCHHWNMSVIHIVQNLFFKGLRTSRINSDYIVLMKNPADKLQIQNLGRQLFPEKLQYFYESYQDATCKPHGYLLIDLSQHTPDKFRLRTDIFAQYTTVYVPKL